MDSLESDCPCRRQVRSLVQEDPTFHGTTKPTTIAPVLHSPGTAATELTRLEPVGPAREAESGEEPHSLHPEKSLCTAGEAQHSQRHTEF